MSISYIIIPLLCYIIIPQKSPIFAKKSHAFLFSERRSTHKFREISNEMPTPSNLGKHFAKFRAGWAKPRARRSGSRPPDRGENRAATLTHPNFASAPPLCL